MTESHATFNRGDFKVYEKYDKPKVFKVRGRDFKSLGSGEVEIDLLVDEKIKKTRLVGVEHVPAIEAKCLSVKNLMDKEYRCEFEPGNFVVWKRGQGLAAVASWRRGAYRLQSRVKEKG